jgi:hypothetical protein
MEPIYIALFVVFAVPAAVLEYTENACFGLWERKTAAAQGHSGAYLHFRNNYVLIFSLMMGKMRLTTSAAASENTEFRHRLQQREQQQQQQWRHMAHVPHAAVSIRIT